MNKLNKIDIISLIDTLNHYEMGLVTEFKLKKVLQKRLDKLNNLSDIKIQCKYG